MYLKCICHRSLKEPKTDFSRGLWAHIKSKFAKIHVAVTSLTMITWELVCKFGITKNAQLHCFQMCLYISIYIYLNPFLYDNALFFISLIITSQIALYFLPSIPLFYFSIEVIMMLSIWGHNVTTPQLSSIGLSPGRHQTITWTGPELLACESLATHIIDVRIKLHIFHFNKYIYDCCLQDIGPFINMDWLKFQHG